MSLKKPINPTKLHLQTEYPEQTTDGIGIRYSIYTQGCKGGLFGDCPSNCKGCQNPETWSFAPDAPGSYWLTVDQLIKKMQKYPLSWGKLTLCGGDPVWQAAACVELMQKLRAIKSDFNIWAYTGLTFEFIQAYADRTNRWAQYLEQIDVLVDGPFLLDQRDISLPWRGSPNQRLIDVPKTLKSGKIVIWQDI